MQNLIITVLGKKGTGKTFLIQNRILKQIKKPVFILDSLDEYFNGIIFKDTNTLILYLKSQKPNVSGVYILRPESDRDVDLFFNLVFCIGNCSLIVEETSLYCNPYKIDENFKKILNYGRHRQINLIAVARRASEIHRDITAQSDFIVSFRQTESRDISVLLTVDENATELTSLNQYKYKILGDFDKKVLDI